MDPALIGFLGVLAAIWLVPVVMFLAVGSALAARSPFHARAARLPFVGWAYLTGLAWMFGPPLGGLVLVVSSGGGPPPSAFAVMAVLCGAAIADAGVWLALVALLRRARRRSVEA